MALYLPPPARAPTPHLVALAWQQVLHWFEANLPVVDADGGSPRDFAGEAKSLACLLLEEQCGTVAVLLCKMAQVATPACTAAPLAEYLQFTRFVDSDSLCA